MGILPLLCQELPLPDPEPVLLVRHHQPQGAVLHLLLNQGVGADDQVGVTGGNSLVGLPLLPGRHGAHQQDGAENQAILFRIALYGLEMLYGQHLRGSHQRALIPVGGGHQQRQHGHDRLAGAHIPLYQAVHAALPCQILPDLPPDLRLCLRQGEGELLQKPQGVRGLLHPVAVFQLPVQLLAPAHQIQERKEFVEHQPPPGSYQGIPVIREMHRLHGLPPGNQLILLQQGRGMVFRLEGVARQRLPHIFLHRLVGQALRQGIPGHQTVHEPVVIRRGEDFGLLHGQDGALCPDQAAEDIESALAQRLFQEGHVVESQLQAAGLIRYHHVQDAQIPDSPLIGDAAYGPLDGADLPGNCPADFHRLSEYLVVPRIGRQQLPHRPDVQLAEQPAGLLAHPFQLRYRRIPVHKPPLRRVYHKGRRQRQSASLLHSPQQFRSIPQT